MGPPTSTQIAPTPSLSMASSQLLPEESITAVPPSGANRADTATLPSSETEGLRTLPLVPVTLASHLTDYPRTAPAGPTGRGRASPGGSTWSPRGGQTASRRPGGDTPDSPATTSLHQRKQL